MQNQKNETKNHDLHVEKIIGKPPAEVFRAIGEGRLFLNCSGGSETLKIDFRVGGKYHVDFIGFEMSNYGEFLEIVPNLKIVFTWCQNPSAKGEPDTKVTVWLKEKGQATHLTLTHVGFKDQSTRDDHEGGWNGGLDDLGAEITQGRLRFHRLFPISVQSLYEKCQNPATFLGRLGDLARGHVDFRVGGTYQVPTEEGEISGKFIEIIPGQKIVFTWESLCGEPGRHDTKVTLNFEAEDENESWLELIHEGLITESQQKKHREGWDWILTRL